MSVASAIFVVLWLAGWINHFTLSGFILLLAVSAVVTGLLRTLTARRSERAPTQDSAVVIVLPAP